MDESLRIFRKLAVRAAMRRKSLRFEYDRVRPCGARPSSDVLRHAAKLHRVRPGGGWAHFHDDLFYPSEKTHGQLRTHVPGLCETFKPSKALWAFRKFDTLKHGSWRSIGSHFLDLNPSLRSKAISGQAIALRTRAGTRPGAVSDVHLGELERRNQRVHRLAIPVAIESINY